MEPLLLRLFAVAAVFALGAFIIGQSGTSGGYGGTGTSLRAAYPEQMHNVSFGSAPLVRPPAGGTGTH